MLRGTHAPWCQPIDLGGALPHGYHIPRRRVSVSMTKPVRWALRSTVLAIVLALSGLAAAHFGLVSGSVGFGLVLSSVLPVSLGLVLGVTGLVQRVSGPRPRVLAGLSTTIAAVHFAVLLAPLAGSFDAPIINDVSTDPAHPVMFDPEGTAAKAAQAAGRSLSLPGPEVVNAQRASYPDLHTVMLAAGSEQVRERVRDAALGLGWEVTYQRPDGTHLEATDTTRVFRFVDDIAVRIRATDIGTAVDVRSRSRSGKGDFGANAARIARFTAALRER